MDRSIARRGDELLSLPVGAGLAVWAGAMVARQPGGWAGPAGSDPAERVIGLARRAADNRLGGDGAATALAATGQFELLPDPSDPPARADIGAPVYASSDRTVARTDGGGTRALAGVLTGLGAGKCWVLIEPHAAAQSDWGEADSSSPAYVRDKPRHVASFSALDSNPASLEAGVIGFLKADGKVWAADESLFDAVKAVVIADVQYAFGEDAQDPDIDPAGGRGHASLLGDLADQGGEGLWRFDRNANSDSPGQGFWLRAARTERTPGGFILRGLTFTGTDFEDSAGEGWDVSGGSSSAVMAAQIVDLATKLVLRDGSNVTDALRAAIQGINESARLKQKYVLKAGATAAGEWSDYGSGSGGINLLARQEDVGEIDETLHITTWLDFGAYRIRPVGNMARSVQVGVVTYSFDYAAISGARPDLGSAEWVTLEGADIHRGEIVRQVFRAISPNIGGKGGRAPMVWGAGSADDDAGWVQSPALPLVLALSPSISRTFGPMSGNVLGEAYLTEDTGSGQFGTTKLLAVDKDSDAAVSAVSAGAYVHVEDAAGAWSLVKVLGARDAPELATVRQWYYEPWASSESDFSNAGAGTITMISAAAAAA